MHQLAAFLLAARVFSELKEEPPKIAFAPPERNEGRRANVCERGDSCSSLPDVRAHSKPANYKIAWVFFCFFFM